MINAVNLNIPTTSAAVPESVAKANTPKRKRAKSIKKRLTSAHSPASFLAARRAKIIVNSGDDDSDVEIVETPTVVVHLDDSMDSFSTDNNKKTCIETVENILKPLDDVSAAVPENSIAAAEIIAEPATDQDAVGNASDSVDKIELPTKDIAETEACYHIQNMAIELNVSLTEIENDGDANDTLKAVDLDQSAVDFDATLTESKDPAEPTESKTSYADILKTSEPKPSTSIDTPKPPASAILFFEDHEGSFSESSAPPVPLYDTISDDSFICDKTITPARNPPSSKLLRKIANKHKPPSEEDDDDDVEIIFDSPNMPSPLPKRRRTNVSTTDLDDSVVFVSESLSTAPAIRSNVNYIAINNAKYLKNKAINTQTKLKKKRLMQALKHTPVKRTIAKPPPRAASVQQPTGPTVVSSYNATKLDTSTTGKRMIFIDGSNVAFSHSNNQGFSVRGISICLEFFEKQGHVVKAVLPQMRVRQNMSTDPALLDQLHKQGRVIFTPCKNLPGKSSISYDDRFILDLAVEFDAAIISNDNFRDLLREDETKYRTVIETRVIGFTWCMDMILFPKDPYGRNGPTIEQILVRTVPE